MVTRGDLDKKKDDRRNDCYDKAGFRLLRVWESTFKKEGIWKKELETFLSECAKQ